MKKPESPLNLFVHDYDQAALEERYEELVVALPGASIYPYSSRAELLREISELPESPNNWPLALIDLQEDGGVQARGEHLLATINEHPLLRRRVVLVAFTRYGYESHDRELRARGASAVLSPIRLGETPNLQRELEVLATGTAQFARIGEPPSSDADRRVVERLSALFPSLENSQLDERERWARARRILVLCHLKHDGWEDAAIKRLPWVSERDLPNLRAELLSSPAAQPPLISAVGRIPHLDRVIDVMLPHLQGSEFIYDVVAERTRLNEVARLDWVRDRLIDRYPPAGSAPEDDAWIPPEYLDALRRLFDQFDRLPPASSHARTETLAERSQRALDGVAAEMGLQPKQAEHYVAHAVMCIEDAEAELASTTGPSAPSPGASAERPPLKAASRPPPLLCPTLAG